MIITEVKTFIQNQLVGTLIVDDSFQGFLHYVIPGSNATPNYLDKKEDFVAMLEEVREWCESQDGEVVLMMY